MPGILLRIPYIQNKVSEVATTQLSGHLGVPVKIGNVDIEWFNRLVLEGLYLEDQDGKVMFEANHVAAGFEIMPLLEGKFVFTTVRLFGFSFNLRKHTPESPLNLQFVIDAFASKDSIKKEKNIDLRFNSIMIRRGNFSYNVDSEKETPGKFNAKHIDIKNLSAKISLKAFNKDSVNAHIKKMSFDEASGFSLNKLSLNVVGNRDSAFVQDFEVRLPQTDLKIGRARIDLSEIDSLPALLNNAPIDLNITPSQICLKDLSPFVPAFKNFADTIELSAEANGYINNFNLKRLTLKYSDKMLFIGQMELKNITHPEETYLLGKVNKMYITTDGISSLANNFNIDDCILLNENDVIPKTAKVIISYTKGLDRTHTINYQFEITLKENREHEDYYISICGKAKDEIKKSDFIHNIRKKFKWSSSTIRTLLTDEVYIGNMVQFKSTTVSYKNHTVVWNDDETRNRLYTSFKKSY